MIEATTAIDLMEQCDSVYIDQLVSDEWEVEAHLNCMGFVKRNKELAKAIIAACELAIVDAERVSPGPAPEEGK